MSRLIDELARLIADDKAILFVGADLRRELGDDPPARHIAAALAQAIDYDGHDQSLPAIAQAYQDTLGRPALLQAVREALQRLDPTPSDLHGFLADAMLPSSKIITLWFDQVLEAALTERQKRYYPVVLDEDVTFVEEDGVTLVKIQGDIGRPDSLILTEEDLRDFLTQRPTVSGLVRVYLATKHLIFLGYDLNSDTFERLFRDVNRSLAAYRRTAYAVTSLPVSRARGNRWAKMDVEVHQVPDLVDFLGQLAASVAAREVAVRSQQAPAGAVRSDAGTVAAEGPVDRLQSVRSVASCRPYKGLESFDQADARIYSGRREESQQLAMGVLGRSLTLLYGESGSGKTSLMQAGVGPLLPRMAGRSALLAVAEPAAGQSIDLIITSGLAEAAASANLRRAPAAKALPTAIRRWQEELDGPIVLILDQFEQFFLVYDEAAQDAAAELLGDLSSDRTLDLRLVFVVREDFLGRMEALAGRLPGLFDGRFRLERLGRQEAEAAIVEPAEACEVSWDPALVQALLDDLYERSGGGVSPPQLQIVCGRLYEAARARAGEDRQERPQITGALFRELGGTQAILGDYLDRAVAAFSQEQRDAVRKLLAALVGSGRVKQRLPLPDLARAAEIAPDQAAGLLDRLVQQRLVQRFEAEESLSSFELTHDVLVARVARWLDDDYDFWAGQKAREILRQGLPSWRQGGVLAPGDTSFVLAHGRRLRLSSEETALVYASAIAYGEDPVGWRERLDTPAQLAALLPLLSNPQPIVRGAACTALSPLLGDSEDAAVHLAELAAGDPDAGVRRRAALAIGNAPGKGGGIDAAVAALAVMASGPAAPAAGARARAEVRAAGAVAGGKSDEQDGPQSSPDALAAAHSVGLAPAEAGVTSTAARRQAALEALALIRHCRPASRAGMPEALRPLVERRVRSMRWRQNRNQILRATVRGGQGGFWGLGLSLGLMLGPLDAVNAGLDQLSLPLVDLLALMALGFPLAGLIGAAAAGGGAFAAATAQALSDRPRPGWHWLAIAAVIAITMGLLFLPLPFLLSGDMRPLQTGAAGLIIGLGLAFPALMPLALARWLRLLVAVVLGAAAFLLVGSLGLMLFGVSPLWLAIVGAVSGIGFFLGLDAGVMKTPALSEQISD